MFLRTVKLQYSDKHPVLNRTLRIHLTCFGKDKFQKDKAKIKYIYIWLVIALRQVHEVLDYNESGSMRTKSAQT